MKEGGWVCRPAPCIDHKTCEIKSRDPYLILGWIQRASQVNATEAALWLCYKEGFKGVGIWFHLRPGELRKYGLTITEDRNLKKGGGYFQKALDIWLKKLRKDHPSAVLTYYNMAIAYWAKKKELLAKAYAIRLEKMGKDHPATKDTKAE